MSAQATAIKATLKALWPNVEGSNAHWTRVSLAALAKLGKGFGFECHYSRKCGGKKERLWDLIWCECDPKTKQMIPLPLVGESEWAKHGVEEDFDKLLLANAPLRLMIFERGTVAEAREVFAELERRSRTFRHPTVARYLAVAWINRHPQGTRCTSWEVGRWATCSRRLVAPSPPITVRHGRAPRWRRARAWRTPT